MKKNSFFAGVVIGGIAGAITSLLVAPKSGEELRDDVKKKSSKIYTDGLNKYEEVSKNTKEKLVKEIENLKEKYDVTSEKFQEELGKLQKTLQKEANTKLKRIFDNTEIVDEFQVEINEEIEDEIDNEIKKTK